jgi:hypothetical protein
MRYSRKECFHLDVLSRVDSSDVFVGSLVGPMNCLRVLGSCVRILSQAPISEDINRQSVQPQTGHDAPFCET